MTSTLLRFSLTALSCAALSAPAHLAAQQNAPGLPHRKVMLDDTPHPLLAAPIQRVSTAAAGPLHTGAALQTLPSFTVNAPDAHPLTSSTLAPAGHWLLLYRTAACLPCDRFMNQLGSGTTPLPTHQPLVVIVGGPHTAPATVRHSKSANSIPAPPAWTTAQAREALERVRANATGLSHATWLTDPTGEAFAALKPAGTPMLYGMDGTHVTWRLAGNPGDAAQLQGMASAWLASSPAQPATPAPASTPIPAAPATAPSTPTAAPR